MAVYTSTGNALRLDFVQSYAEQAIKAKLNSSFFQRSPIVTFMAGKLGGDSPLGRPGTLAVLGGDGKLSRAKRETLAGYQVQIRIQNANNTPTAAIGEFGQSPSHPTAQTRNRTSAFVRWAQPIATPIKIDGVVTRTSNNAKIANAIEEATQEAMACHLDDLKYRLWRGNPSNQTADEWDDYLGILQAIDIDNTYGGLARTGATHYWSGNRVTTALSATLNLVDHAEMGVESCASIGYPLKNYGMGANLWFAGSKVYYKLKQEALARGQTVTVTDMPEFSKVGVKYEAIQYGASYIVREPTFTGDWSAYDSDVTDASKLLVGLTTSDWYVSFNSTNNFKVGKFTYQFDERPGGEDATTSNISTQGRIWCEAPHRQIVFTNVS